MSLVTTPTFTSSASSRQRAAIRLLLPDPTGPPMPTRRALGLAGKEALPSLLVDRCGELESNRGGCGLLGEGPAVGRDGACRELHRGRKLGEPARRHGRIERQQLQRRGGDGRR